MAQETVVSKTLTIELKTGKTKTIRGQGNRVTRTEPETVRVSKLSTVTTYNRDDQGIITNATSVVRQEISADDYAKLDEANRTTEEKGAGRNQRTVYYAILARKAGDSNEYKTTDAVGKVLDKETATLFEKAAADHSNKRQESTFSNFDKATNDAIKKTEGLQDADVRNQTGLAGNAEQPQDPPNTGKPPIEAIKGFPVRGRTEEDSYGILKYPENLSDTQDYIQFTMFEYGVKELSSSGSGNLKVITGFGERTNKDLKGSVTLPIQNQITDQNRVEWGAGDINPLQAFMANSLYGADINNIAAGVDDALATGRSALKRGGDDIANYVRTYFIQQAIQNKNLLSRMTGAILNPNVELLFNRPQLRPFSFRFFLAARSDTEAIQVKKIIRFFKQGMSVKETKTDIFLKAPNIFRIKYRYGRDGTDHPGLNRIKDCALTSCSVDYTPNNSYMTFEDGTMTAYAITLQFQELEPITETDYTGSADGIPKVPVNEIGF